MKEAVYKKFNKIKNTKLIASIAIDIIGMATYIIPALGEAGDVVWAPISAFLLLILYPNRKKMALMGFAEELLPFTDFIPTAYLAWRAEYVKNKNETLSNFIKNEVGDRHIINKTLEEISSDKKYLSN